MDEIEIQKLIILIAVTIVIAGIIDVILNAFKIKKEEKTRNEFEDAIVNCGIYSQLSDQFQILFESRKLQRVYNCSRQLAANFDHDEYHLNYLQKYFGLVINDETIGHLKSVYKSLKQIDKIVDENPKWKRFEDEILPTFSMYYESPSGRNWYRSEFEFNTETVKELCAQVNLIMGKLTSRKMQRSKMTKELREAILRRDNWTCQICGNSKFKEPNLLLEVDHIIPIAKGGKTEPSNLQLYAGSVTEKNQMDFMHRLQKILKVILKS